MKNTIKLLIFVQIILFSSFLYFLYAGNSLGAEVMEVSIVGSSVLIMASFLRTDRKKHVYKDTYVVIFALSFITLVGLAITYSSNNPDLLYNSQLMFHTLLSLVSIVLLVLAIYKIGGKLNTIKLYLDGIVIVIAVFALPLHVFLRPEFLDLIEGISRTEVIIRIITVFTAYTLNSILFTSSKLKALGKHTQAMMFTVVVMMFYYLFQFADVYHNGPSVLTYPVAPSIFAFFIVNISAILHLKRPVEVEYSQLPENYGTQNKSIFIITPLVTMVALRLVSVYFLIPIVLFYVAYYLGIRHIQRVIRRLMLVQFEADISKNLESIVADRTKQLSRANSELYELSITDPLTKLYNRKRFLEELDERIEANIGFIVYYLDLDNFNVINDIHGYETGDALLTIVSRRLKDDLGKEFFVARVADDEIGVIMNSSGVGVDASREVRYAQIITDSIMKKVFYKDFSFEVGVSVGAACFPSDAKTSKDIMKFSVLAMLEAKRNSGNRKILFYDSQYGLKVERENIIEYELSNVDFDQEFRLVYQPQYDLVTKEVLGFEALLRWTSPKLGVVSPAEFIPVSERTGSIVKIGKWVIEQAFIQAREWNADSVRNYKISINLSPVQFDSYELLPFLKMQAIKREVKPQWIEFEVTENVGIMESESMKDLLREFRNLGYTIAIDDFGTGYSSLGYIKDYSVNRLKIAKELVDHIVENVEERYIIQAIILMAKGMSLEIIAEGCETEAQAKILIESGCPRIQGYYFAKPLEVDEITERFMSVGRWVN